MDLEAIVREEYARIGGDAYRPARKRVSPKPCPRGNDSAGGLRCSGVVVAGVSVVDPHVAPASDFGHDNNHCARGRARCRASQCRRCAGVHSLLRSAVNRARHADLSDADIRAATPQKRCPGCRETKPSTSFKINRGSLTGLHGHCRACQDDSSARTTLPETRRRHRRRKDRRRRAAKAGTRAAPYTERDVFDAHAAEGSFGCAHCGVPFTDPYATFHLDHLWPLSLGGSDTLDNVRFACSGCNLSKSARDPWSWHVERLREAGAVGAAARLERAAGSLPVAEWIESGRARYRATVSG